jgi:hypothetical protein
VSLFPYEAGGNSFLPNIGIQNLVIVYELLMGCPKSQTEKHVTSCGVRKVSCANIEKTQKKKLGNASIPGSNFGFSQYEKITVQRVSVMALTLVLVHEI